MNETRATEVALAGICQWKAGSAPGVLGHRLRMIQCAPGVGLGNLMAGIRLILAGAGLARRQRLAFLQGHLQIGIGLGDGDVIVGIGLRLDGIGTDFSDIALRLAGRIHGFVGGGVDLLIGLGVGFSDIRASGFACRIELPLRLGRLLRCILLRLGEILGGLLARLVNLPLCLDCGILLVASAEAKDCSKGGNDQIY